MSLFHKNILVGASGGAGGAAAATYVDDVFSCVVWDGHPAGGEQDIDAGIDLTEGGLVWAKARDASDHHYLVDSEIGKTGSYYDNLATSLTGQVVTNEVYGVETFNNNGFTVDGSHARLNDGSKTYVSWVFKETPGFFDIVKYTGNSTAGHDVAHDLGSVPGCIFIKKLGGGSDWYVYHRELGNTKALRLNDDGNQVTGVWNSTTPTSTHFTLANHTEVNESGQQYIAYVFAHDDQSFGTDSDEAIIKCGTYEGNATTGNSVDVGFEPQWLMIKNADDSSTNWVIFDSMRGFHAKGIQPRRLSANSSDTEANNLEVTREPRGFSLTGGGTYTNSNNHTFVYVAIRRPHKPPSAATEVFAMDTAGGTSPTPPQFTSGFPVDLAWRKTLDNTTGVLVGSRLQGTNYMRFTSNAIEDSASALTWDHQNGWSGLSSTDADLQGYLFKRAAGFMDVVCWVGTSSSGSSSRALSHNLAATPELIIGKRRSSLAGNWSVYSSVTGINNELELNEDAAVAAATNMWKAAPTDSNFTVGYGLDGNTYQFVAYLFASLSGVSKIGSYSGTGSNVDVNCGFTAGARFVMIKRTDATGDWHVFDTDNGIVSGNDPYWRPNVEGTEVTGNDYIDPLNSGFTVTSSAPAALNASGGTYLFLAIA